MIITYVLKTEDVTITISHIYEHHKPKMLIEAFIHFHGCENIKHSCFNPVNINGTRTSLSCFEQYLFHVCFVCLSEHTNYK